MSLRLIRQLIEYNDNLPKHLRTEFFWLRARFVNGISYGLKSEKEIRRTIHEAQSKRWVFILGCNNSGTSLLYYLLSKHPQVASFPVDGQFFTSALPVPMNHDVGRLWSERPDVFRLTEKDTNIDPHRLVHDWFHQIGSRNRPIMMEKSPPDTIRSRWLQRVFDDAFFIGITRNGYAVAEGISRRKKVPIQRGARHWVEANRWMLRDAEHLLHFRRIKYEDLVADPETVLQDLLEFVGADMGLYVFDKKKGVAITQY